MRFHAVIEPDFKLLPLIANFFRKRYSDQALLIYDVKRKYGLLYDLNNVSEVQLSCREKNSLSKPNEILNLDETEEHYQNGGKNTFKAQTLKSEKT